MITIEIIAAGKIKEDFLKKAIDEYVKRLGRYCKIIITQIPDFPDDKNSSEREGALMLPKLKGHCAALCVEGEQFSSEQFAQFIKNCAVEGNSRLAFVIGGSCGLSEQVKAACKLRLSFSKMTFPHQLMRLILLEQIYRAFKIVNGESYHK